MKKQTMLHTAAIVNKDSKTDGIIEAVVGSTAVLDRMGDVISQDGWLLDNYKKNPVILWGHNVRQDRPPIGKALEVWIDGKQNRTKKLMFKIQFDLQDSFAAEIYRKVKEGFVNTVSVGFIPLERDSNTYTKAELLELSFVPVPANQEALVSIRALGDEPVALKDLYSIVKDDGLGENAEEEKKDDDKKEDESAEGKEDETAKTEDDNKEEESTDEGEGKGDEEKEDDKKEEEELEDKKEGEEEEKKTDDEPEDKKEGEEEDKKEEEEKKEDDAEKGMEFSASVVPYKSLGIAPESEAWDGPGELAKVKELSLLKDLCAWVDSSATDKKASYKLAHHKGDEGNKAVWRGVASAMASLLGAKGGASIPEEDRKGVYTHLVEHYKEYDKEAPEFKDVEEQVLAKYEEEIHALVLDREEKHMVKLIKKALEELKDQKIEKENTIKISVEGKDAEEKAKTTKALIDALKVLDKATALITRSV